MNRTMSLLSSALDPLVHNTLSPRAGDFAAAFSRFEYALKKAGFVETKGNTVEATWDRFGNSHTEMFFDSPSDELARALDYLTTKPPKRQVLTADKRLDWDTDAAPVPRKSLAPLLVLVRRVRNNLFHGGKWATRSPTPRVTPNFSRPASPSSVDACRSTTEFGLRTPAPSNDRW